MVLDAVEDLRSSAQMIVFFEPKTAAEHLTKANNLLFSGKLDQVHGARSQEQAFADWETMVGGSMKDPEFRKRVYQAAADYRKMEMERADQAARARMHSQAAVDRNKKRSRKRR